MGYFFTYFFGGFMLKYFVGLCLLLYLPSFGQQWDGANNPTAPIDRTGNVAIGGNATSDALRVYGKALMNELEAGALKINSGGTVGIGGTATAATLRVYGNSVMDNLEAGSLTIPTGGNINIVGSLSASGSCNFTSLNASSTITSSSLKISGDVGIGTVIPLGKLHLSDGTLLCSGTIGGVPMQNTAGTRMMWIPSKGAFRAGTLDGSSSSYWNANSIGQWSFAAGYNPWATQRGCIAMGYNAIAVKEGAVAIGSYVDAGNANTPITEGQYTIAIGDGAKAWATHSNSIGNNTYATGNYSTALGTSNSTNGTLGFVAGYGNINNAAGATVLGCFAKEDVNSSKTDWVLTDPLFVIGNGGLNQYTAIPSNAITVLKNANTGINTDTPEEMFYVKGGQIGISNTGTYKGLANTDQWSTLGMTPADVILYGHNMRFRENTLRLGVRDANTMCIEWGNQKNGDLEFNLIENIGVTNEMKLFGGANPTFRLTLNGDASSSGTWYDNSDIRFKKDVVKIEQPLQKIMDISGYTYSFKQEEFPHKGFPTTPQMGLIAQEVEKIAPEVVKTDADGYKSIAYSHLVPLLVEAIKTQQSEIQDLRSRLEKLESLLIGKSTANTNNEQSGFTKSKETKFEDGVTMSCQPNPTAGELVINFFLPQDMTISLSVADQAGNEIARIIDKQHYKQGLNSVRFDGNDANGQPLITGTYFYNLSTDKMEHTQQFKVIR